ncbi:hypothetical protein MMC29_004908 [Sticta canariensis]|nr:hypothetical protein [Sticta canariensis]
MPPKRKAEEILAGPSKKRSATADAGTSVRAHRNARSAPDNRAEQLSAAYEAIAAAVVPALTELTARTAREVEESETLLMELQKDLDGGKIKAEEEKRRLVMEQMFGLKAEEQQASYRQDLARQDKVQEELLIHERLKVMQLVRTKSRTPNETDKEVRLSKMRNDREVMKPRREQTNPLYTAGLGRGRFYIEVAAIWDDWCERKGAVAVQDRENIIPRLFKEVKAAKLAKEEELARAAEAQRAAQAVEKAVERERFLELAETRRRLPPIPAHAPGQHPEYRRRKGQIKWSKRANGAGSAPPLTKRVSLKPTAPKKPVGGPKAPGKGKSRRNVCTTYPLVQVRNERVRGTDR